VTGCSQQTWGAWSGTRDAFGSQGGQDVTYRHRLSPERYDVLEEPHVLVDKLRHHRGPDPGEGRSHGRPWRGIVEDTPCVWVTWVTAACKRLGRSVPQAIIIDGVRVPLVSVQLTFGRRYYFRAPCCGRRVEALFFLDSDVGCRQCLHLGYESQVRRPGSVWQVLDDLFDRRPLQRLVRRWEHADSPMVREIVVPLREMMRERIEGMLSRISVEEEDDGCSA
jgi:hypothetical protein